MARKPKQKPLKPPHPDVNATRERNIKTGATRKR